MFENTRKIKTINLHDNLCVIWEDIGYHINLMYEFSVLQSQKYIQEA